MAVEFAVWRVDSGVREIQLTGSRLESELEDILASDISIASPDWLLIGRQVPTDSAGIIDLLAIDRSGSLVVIELKRAKTYREVLAQLLDYGSWVKNLTVDDIALLYERYSGSRDSVPKSLNQALKDFEINLTKDDGQINQSHQLVIFGTELDASTERIAKYLQQYGVPINALFFRIFEDEGRRYLTRAWLIDPQDLTVAGQDSSTKGVSSWNGEFYVSFGDDESRSWEDALKWGFVSGGGGDWYSGTLGKLKVGNRIWVNVPGKGYVGVGRVTGERVPLSEFKVIADGVMRPFIEVADAKRSYQREVTSQDKAEYFVPIEWIKAVKLSEAVKEIGFFGNQNTVCQPKDPKWDHTVRRLKAIWNIPDEPANGNALP